jgi:signal transduction histidine kinase
MSMLSARAHVVLCAPGALSFPADGEAFGFSGLNVLLDASQPLEWDTIERCYLLAYKITNLVAGVRDLHHVFEELLDHRRSLTQYALTAHNLQGPVADARYHLRHFRELPAELRDQRIDRAQTELAQLAETVKDLLEFYTTSGPILKAGEDADLVEAVRQAVDRLNQRRVLAQKRNLKVTLSAIEPVVMDFTHVRALRIVVAELLENAAEYVDRSSEISDAASSDPQIEIQVVRGPAFVRIEIVNGGPVLRMDELATLNAFEARSEPLKRRSSEHYGIGLRSCKYIADKLKAEIKYVQGSDARTIARVSYPET